MTKENVDILALAKSAGEGEGNDQSVAQKGPTREITPAGKTPARFVSYVETGSHMAYHEGKATKNKPMVRGKFELLGKKHRNEHTDNEGNVKVWYNTIEFGMGKNRELPLSSNEKAGFYKLLKKMMAGRDGIKNMGEMLGEGFMIEIVHSKSTDGKQTYANMKKDGEWTVSAPFYDRPGDDGEMEAVALDIPAFNEPIQFLQQSKACKVMWDTLFIDGEFERTVKEEGKDERKEMVSKNFLQNRILASVTFEGSLLQEALGGIEGIVIEEPSKVEDETPVVMDDEAPAADEKAADLKKELGDEKDEDTSGSDNPLAALGF